MPEEEALPEGRGILFWPIAEVQETRLQRYFLSTENGNILPKPDIQADFLQESGRGIRHRHLLLT